MVQALLTERNGALAEMRETRAQERVKHAFDRGYLSPALREWALALWRSDEAGFGLFIETSIPPFAHLFQPPTRATT